MSTEPEARARAQAEANRTGKPVFMSFSNGSWSLLCEVEGAPWPADASVYLNRYLTRIDPAVAPLTGADDDIGASNERQSLRLQLEDLREEFRTARHSADAGARFLDECMTYAKAHGKRYDEAYSTWLERMVRKAEAAPINCNSCGDWFQPKTPGETECSSSCYADIRGIGDHEDEPPPAAEEDDEGEDDNDE